MAKVKLNDVAVEARETWKQSKTDVPVVGLEHLEPDEIWLKRWDLNPDENTFTKGFKKGQLLFGRRRAYQKKMSVASCDGICSGDITVIAAKPEKILPELLPFYLRTDAFFDFAVRGSGGSLSPRVKWSHISDYEFDLPPMEEQKKLAELLWAANDLKEKYKKVITATDEMLKAKFREMFGNPFGEGFKSDVLSSVCHVNPRRDKIILGDDEKVSFIPMSSVSEDGMIINPEIRNYFEVKKGFTYFKEHDVLFAKITPCMENGKGAIAEGLKNNIGFGSTEFHIIRAKEGRSSPLWLLALTLDPEFRLRAEKHMTGTGGQRRVPSSFLSNFPINQPDIVKVGEYDKIYVKAESAKTALKKSIADIDQVMKGLING